VLRTSYPGAPVVSARTGLGIDVHGKVKYTVNGLRGGVVFQF